MKKKHLNFCAWLTLSIFLLSIASCSDEDYGKGDVEFEITDAPIDDAAVSAVVVTIADVKVNGVSVSGFSKQSINLLAYQEGNTKALVTALQLDARSYSNLTLVLDLDHDVNGDAPGCYVRTTDNTKYKLKTTTSGIMDLTLNQNWTVQKNATSKVILDFDLRKSVTYSSNTSEKYRFVSDTNLKSAIRVVAKSDAGKIMGTYEESVSSDADEVVAFAYKKGTFNESTETQPQGDDNMLFANAINSAKVKSSLTGNSFTFALLEEGQYEIYFAKYKESPTGEMSYNVLLKSETMVNGEETESITLQPNITVNIAANITGLF